MNEKEVRELAQTIRRCLPTLDVSARRTLIMSDYHVFIKLPREECGFIFNSFEEWQHFQAIALLFSSSLLSSSLPEDIRPRFQSNNRWIEGLRLEPLL